MKIGRNERCPCGSGAKYKKCCGGSTSTPKFTLPHTQVDRKSALTKLLDYVARELPKEDDAALAEFWGPYLDDDASIDRVLAEHIDGMLDAWLCFDRALGAGDFVVDRALAKLELLTAERAYLLAMKDTCVKLYQVRSTVPGVSVELYDMLDTCVLTVNERTASRTLCKDDRLLARVIARGSSGGAELELGALTISHFLAPSILKEMQDARDRFSQRIEFDVANAAYKEILPDVFQLFIANELDPVLPELQNTDGESLVISSARFVVLAAKPLREALDRAVGVPIEAHGDNEWVWLQEGADGRRTTVGIFRLKGDILELECNSVERAARLHKALDQMVGTHLRHQATTHEDAQSLVREQLRQSPKVADEPQEVLPAHIADALVFDHYARHYKGWVDEPVPALGGMTPREGAKKSSHTARVADLIRGIEGLYQRALKDGITAYDPSWMWAELDLDDETTRAVIVPAHERVFNAFAGLEDASKKAAEAMRMLTGFTDASTTVAPADLMQSLDLRRFFRDGGAIANDTGPAIPACEPYLELLVNLDLHRRKVFWVDHDLAFLLENTEVDVKEDQVRLPFAFFALVFSDRHTLSIAERLLGRRKADPLCGQILRVATAYIHIKEESRQRTLAVTLAVDALGADLPSLVDFEVPIGSERAFASFLEKLHPEASEVPGLRNTDPETALLRLILNTILFATSADAKTGTATPLFSPRRRQSNGGAPVSESVFNLPGTIDILGIKHLQDLRRAPGGGELLSRFMVRGHWRKPQKHWDDQRLRWIAPYWKGPPLASVIEKAYRLRGEG